MKGPGDFGHSAFLDTQQGIGIVDGDHECGVDETATADEPGVGVHQAGESKIDLKVTRVELDAPAGPTVDIVGCYDSAASQVVRTDTDEAVAPGTPPRFNWLITVVQYKSEAGQPWLVTNLDPQLDQPC